MQALFSRARTVTNSCRCSLCHPPQAAVSRRGAAATRRRRNGVNDAATVFYTTVFAAALWTDAVGKISESRKLDEALERTRKETEQLDQQNRQRLQALGIETEDVAELQSSERMRMQTVQLDQQNRQTVKALGTATDDVTDLPAYNMSRSRRAPAHEVDPIGRKRKRKALWSKNQSQENIVHSKDGASSIQPSISAESGSNLRCFASQATASPIQHPLSDAVAQGGETPATHIRHSIDNDPTAPAQPSDSAHTQWQEQSINDANSGSSELHWEIDSATEEQVYSKKFTPPEAYRRVAESSRLRLDAASVKGESIHSVHSVASAPRNALDTRRLGSGPELPADDPMSVLVQHSIQHEEMIDEPKQRNRSQESVHEEFINELQHRRRLEEDLRKTQKELGLVRDLRTRRRLRSTIEEHWANLEALNIELSQQRIAPDRLLQYDEFLESDELAESYLAFETANYELVKDQVVKLKAALRQGHIQNQLGEYFPELDEHLRKLAAQKLRLLDAADVLRELKCVAPQQEKVSDVWKPSVESWPVGRTPQELWNTPFVFELRQYWRARQELALSITICRLIKYALDHDRGLSIDLGLEASHPLQSQTLDKKVLETEIYSRVRVYLAVKAMVKLRNEDLAINMERADFPNFTSYNEAPDLHRQMEQVRELNNRLSEAFESSKDSWQALARICEILAQSKTPPNIHTFNFLLINFSRIGLPDISCILYDALQACGISKNELTAVAMLQAYSDLKLGSKFDQFVRRMDAYDGQGLILRDQASEELIHNDASIMTGHVWVRGQWRDWRDEASEDAAALSDVHDKLRDVESGHDRRAVLRMPLNQQLYEALIVGYNGFDQGQQAARMTARMLASGFHANAKIFNSLLRRNLMFRSLTFIDRCMSLIRTDRLTGSQPELTESVYLLFHMWCVAWTRINAEAVQATKASPLAKKCKIAVKLLNEYALRKRLLNQALVYKPRRFTDKQHEQLQHQLDAIRRLERPVLDFEFDAYGVRNFTRETPESCWSDGQPVKLETFVQQRLAILHQDYVSKHGSYPTRELEDGRLTGFVVGQAATKLVHEQETFKEVQRLRRSGEASNNQAIEHQMRRRGFRFVGPVREQASNLAERRKGLPARDSADINLKDSNSSLTKAQVKGLASVAANDDASRKRIRSASENPPLWTQATICSQELPDQVTYKGQPANSKGKTLGAHVVAFTNRLPVRSSIEAR